MADAPSASLSIGLRWRATLLWSLFVSGCPATHAADAAVDEAAGPPDAASENEDAGACSRDRSITLVVVVNSDGANDLRRTRAELVAALVERLVTGDLDADGVADVRAVDELRVMATLNEICLRDFASYDGRWTSPAEFMCPTGGTTTVQVIRPGTEWRDELTCRLTPRVDAGSCAPEPLEAALVALASVDDGIDVSPAVPLGGTLNAAWRERDDLVVLLLEAADWRDDCSRRVEFPADVCMGTPDMGGSCCPENLAPVSRTSTGLRRIFGERPYVVASLGMHPGFDAATDDPADLDRWLAEGAPPACAVRRLHRRMIELARDLSPHMDLVPLTCDGASPPALADLEPLARHIVSRFCAP